MADTIPIFVFSAQDSPYQWWQTEALWESFRHVRQCGRLMGLISGSPYETEGRGYSCPVEHVPDRSVVAGDHYPPYNKPAALLHWLSRADIGQTPLVLLDPDCLFHRPLEARPLPGQPCAQWVAYMNPSVAEGRRLVERYCRRNRHLVRPVGIPLAIWSSDLLAILPRWWSLLTQMRAESLAEGNPSWITEMWALNIAMAEFGLDCLVHDEFCQFVVEDEDRRPITHYCHPIQCGGVTWDKWSYKAWTEPPREVPGMNLSSRLLLRELRRIAQLRGFERISTD